MWPDLKLLDYAVCGALHCSSECIAMIVYETVKQLKQAIVDEWCTRLRRSLIAVSMNRDDV